VNPPLNLVSLAERPDLVDAMWDMPNGWPKFMLADPIGDLLFSRLAEVFPQYQYVALDDDERVIAKVNSIPFGWTGNLTDLPQRGWDGVQELGFQAHWHGDEPTAVSLLEARIVPSHLGTGLSSRLLAAVRERTRAHGFLDLFGPVRPTGKAAHPDLSMADYLQRRRPDGLSDDPWIRTHERLGGRVVAVCPVSMCVPGTLAQWREWTGLPLDRSGVVTVPGALNPILVAVEHDHAVYLEPNVWIHHDLRGQHG
jgi:GNAT superfamily N-acetyltransferase